MKLRRTHANCLTLAVASLTAGSGCDIAGVFEPGCGRVTGADLTTVAPLSAEHVDPILHLTLSTDEQTIDRDISLVAGTHGGWVAADQSLLLGIPNDTAQPGCSDSVHLVAEITEGEVTLCHVEEDVDASVPLSTDVDCEDVFAIRLTWSGSIA